MLHTHLPRESSLPT